MSSDEKADRYLAEGRVRISGISSTSVLAEVRGSGDEPYRVSYVAGVWRCDCPARVVGCAHVKAVGKIVDVSELRIAPALVDPDESLEDVPVQGADDTVNEAPVDQGESDGADLLDEFLGGG